MHFVHTNLTLKLGKRPLRSLLLRRNQLCPTLRCQMADQAKKDRKKSFTSLAILQESDSQRLREKRPPWQRRVLVDMDGQLVVRRRVCIGWCQM